MNGTSADPKRKAILEAIGKGRPTTSEIILATRIERKALLTLLAELMHKKQIRRVVNYDDRKEARWARLNA